MSIMFNEICINEEMLPKYTYFKLNDPAAHKYNSTLEYRRDLVKRQITLCKNNISTYETNLKALLWTIHKSIPAKYDKSNTGIRTDPEENMSTENVFYV